jgi:hypothetical protein
VLYAYATVLPAWLVAWCLPMPANLTGGSEFYVVMARQHEYVFTYGSLRKLYVEMHFLHVGF